MSKPNRIASLISSATEILFAIGAGDRVVAVSHECDCPDEVQELPRATFSHVDAMAGSREIDEQVKQLSGSGAALYEIDRDLLVRLQPDLIVTQAQCDVCAVKYDDVVDLVKSQQALAHTEVLPLQPQRLEDVFKDVLRVGQATGDVEQAKSFVAQLRERLTEVDRRVSDRPRPKVAVIEWTDPLMLAANWVPELIAAGGGRCDLTTAGEHSDYARWEDLLAYDPDVLIVSPCGFDLPRCRREIDELAKRDAWKRLSAVQSGRVHAIDGGAYFNRSGPRLVDTVEILDGLLHPGS